VRTSGQVEMVSSAGMGGDGNKICEDGHNFCTCAGLYSRQNSKAGAMINNKHCGRGNMVLDCTSA